MLAASIHEHAGLGNQIWRYVCCRVFAENLGYEWGVSNPGWRGPFLNIDWGREVPMNVEEDSDFNINSGFVYYKELSELQVKFVRHIQIFLIYKIILILMVIFRGCLT